MINDRKIYNSIFFTSIFFVTLVLITAKFLGSDFWYRLTNVRMDFLALFEDFVFSLIVDVLGVFIAIFFLMLFIKDVKKSDNPVEMMKNKINETKKEASNIVVGKKITDTFLKTNYRV